MDSARKCFTLRLRTRTVLRRLVPLALLITIVIYVATRVLLQRHMPTIYCITPTFERPVQKAELTRLRQAFRHVPKLHWIVVEDSGEKTELVSDFLERSGISHTHLNVPTPAAQRLSKSVGRDKVHRGTLQRNLALSWIRNYVDPAQSGVVYFADDDNTYDEQLFEIMRSTKRVSVWPAGFTGGLTWQGPKCQGDRVVGWYARWGLAREFKADMCAFAFNTKLLFEYPEARFNLSAPLGFQETNFLKQITTVEQLEAKSCSKVLVWHTRASPPNLEQEADYRKESSEFNSLVIEV